MRGIVLAGGSGSRLYPLTRITNKHLLPVYDKPMIYYAVGALVAAGIEQILVVTGGNHAGDFLPLLGNGESFGLKHIDYTYQEHAGGIAQALSLAKHWSDGDPVCVMLGDNIFEFSIRDSVREFERSGSTGARLLLAEVDDPSAYGVAVMKDERIVRIDEKPTSPASRFAVTGCYLYDARVFDYAEELQPSARGELEITDVNNHYVRSGALSFDRLKGYWADCGESFQSYLRAINLVATHGANKVEAKT
jgi:glucose-1-phosphate thymidylyltransferase